MKKFKIYFAEYPFNKETVLPNSEEVEGISLKKAYKKLKRKYDNNIEIFEGFSKEI